MSSAADIEVAAAQWVTRRTDPGWNAHDQAALDAWLQADTAHRVAFLRLESVWRRADRLSAMRTPGVADAPVQGAGPKPAAASETTTAIRWSWHFRLAAGIALAIALSIAGYQFAGRDGHSYATEIGGHRTVPLIDGTRVELNTDTRIRATVSDRQRVAWLEKGEAYFEVAHDATRPFLVYAGDRRITVLGTKFSVKRDGERVEVAVTEGKVRLEALGQKQLMLPSVSLTPGGSVIATKTANLVAAKTTKQIADQLSWRRGALAFDASTLAEVAAQFNRYNRKKLVVDDVQAGEIRISGAFEASDVEAFARLLEHAFKLKVERDADEIRVSM